jgi:hypothetical protein
MSERHPDLSDEALTRRLATELPRHAAPAHLRQRLAAAGRRGARPPRPWLAPAVAALATAALLVLFLVPLLPRVTPVDPAQRMVRAVVSEHTRALLWGARHSDILPTSLPWIAQETGIGMARVFGGDDRLELLGAEPVYLDQRRGVAVHYRDADGHHVTYVVLPAPSLVMPERARVKIDRFRPALLRDEGFSVWLWKQGDLACFMVADLVSASDLERFKDYFVRVRLATEPIPAY